MTSPIPFMGSSQGAGGAFNSADFLLNFPDLGAGAVDLTPSRGGVSETFTRATAATTVNSAGLIVAVSSGVARSYYDPTSLGYLGYLAEGARTNLALRSSEFDNASWSKTDVTPTADAATSPDGTANADLLAEGTAGNAQTNQSCAFAAGSTITVGIWVKRSGAGAPQWVQLITGSAGGTSRVWADITNGVIGSNTGNNGTHTFVGKSIKAYPNGWYRITLTVTIITDTGSTLGIASASADSSTARVNNATYLAWGAQFEVASFASSYIPTTNATVTRNADVLTYPLTGWFNAVEGTMLAVARAPNEAQTGAFVRAMEIGDGTANEFIALSRNSSASRFFVTDGGVSQASLTLGTWSNDTSVKIVGAYAANDVAGSQDGGTVQTDTSATIPTVTTLAIGSSAIGAAHLFGPLSRTAYWGYRRSDGDLQALTA